MCKRAEEYLLWYELNKLEATTLSQSSENIYGHNPHQLSPKIPPGDYCVFDYLNFVPLRFNQNKIFTEGNWIDIHLMMITTTTMTTIVVDDARQRTENEGDSGLTLGVRLWGGGKIETRELRGSLSR